MADGTGAGGNAFVNDGSFMEMFRRLQEQQKDQLKDATQNEGEKDRVSASDSASSAPNSTGVMRHEDHPEPESKRETHSLETCNTKEKVTEKEEGEKTGVKKLPPLVKASQGSAILGKRKSLLKSIELREKRKRRREELEEERLAEQDDKDKSSAWKAYMAQVKAYEARSCTDEDGHRRPLVK